MELREALKMGIEFLNQGGSYESRLDAEVLLCHVLKKDKIFMITNPHYHLLPSESAEYIQAVNQRASGKPVSYITGEKEFMGLPFRVNEAVLIPRPDTELLVEEVIRISGVREVKVDAKKNEAHIEADSKTQTQYNLDLILSSGQKNNPEKYERTTRILDLCTGSGAIGISLAYYIKGAEVIASDISEAALRTAQENAKLNGVDSRMTFVLSNLLEAFKSPCAEFSFDIVATNPPYIKKAVIPDLMYDVKNFEPVLALDGGEDGLDFYRKIIPGSAKVLKTGGSLIMEIGFDQGEQVSKLLVDDGRYINLRVLKDLSGFDRVVAAERA